jgi:hypothetical protein
MACFSWCLGVTNRTYEFLLDGPFPRQHMQLIAKLPVLSDDIEISAIELAEHHTVKTVFANPTGDMPEVTNPSEKALISRVRELRRRMNRQVIEKLDIVETLGERDAFWRLGHTPYHKLTPSDVLIFCKSVANSRKIAAGQGISDSSAESSDEGLYDLTRTGEQRPDPRGSSNQPNLVRAGGQRSRLGGSSEDPRGPPRAKAQKLDSSSNSDASQSGDQRPRKKAATSQGSPVIGAAPGAEGEPVKIHLRKQPNETGTINWARCKAMITYKGKETAEDQDLPASGTPEVEPAIVHLRRQLSGVKTHLRRLEQTDQDSPASGTPEERPERPKRPNFLALSSPKPSTGRATEEMQSSPKPSTSRATNETQGKIK